MDVTCSHCGEPWDVYGLQHDAVGYLTADEVDTLAPLGPVTAVTGYLARYAGTSGNGSARTALLEEIRSEIGLDAGQELTVPALATYWWDSTMDTTRDTDDNPRRDAAARVVNTAIYRGVLSGKGCLECGFAHTQDGPYADQTMSEVLDGGVTDADPIEFLD